jgi:hypothetical protein
MINSASEYSDEKYTFRQRSERLCGLRNILNDSASSWISTLSVSILRS